MKLMEGGVFSEWAVSGHQEAPGMKLPPTLAVLYTWHGLLWHFRASFPACCGWGVSGGA